MVLLSVKAGPLAGEIAKLTWPMVIDSQGRLSGYIELHDNAAKKVAARTIPLHRQLISALQILAVSPAQGRLWRSKRGIVEFGRCDQRQSVEHCPSCLLLLMLPPNAANSGLSFEVRRSPATAVPQYQRCRQGPEPIANFLACRMPQRGHGVPR